MVKLSSFIYCLDADRRVLPDGKGEIINAMGVLSAITPEFVPGTFSFTIVFSIHDIDLANPNRIRIVFSEQNGKALVDSNEIPLMIVDSKNTSNISDKLSGITMSMDLKNVVFEKEGKYKTSIYINGETTGEYEICVKGRRNDDKQLFNH